MSKVIFWNLLIGEWGGHDPLKNWHNEFWFSTEGYTKVDFFYSGYGGECKINKTQFREVRHWLETNLEGEVIIKYDDRRSSGSILASAYFQNENDAIAFKLAWSKELEQ